MTKTFITIPWFLPAFRAGGPVQSIANLVEECHEEVEYFIFCGDVDLPPWFGVSRSKTVL